MWCSHRRKQIEALTAPDKGGPSKRVLFFSILRNLTLLSKEASHVSYSQKHFAIRDDRRRQKGIISSETFKNITEIALISFARASSARGKVHYTFRLT